MEKDVGQLGLEDLGVLFRREVAPVASPAGDRPGHPGDHPLHRALALGAALLAAEVLLGDDVRRVLGPRLRELDFTLLECGARGIADDGVAELPFDLVEGVYAPGREAALDGQSRLASFCFLCSAFAHQVLLVAGSGMDRASLRSTRTEPPSAESPAIASAGSARVPANPRQPPMSRPPKPSRHS